MDNQAKTHDVMIRRESNILPNVRGIINGGEGKNYGLPDCMAYLMESIGESEELNYWLFAGVTGEGLTQVYNKNNTSSCEYCVSGYLAGPLHTEYLFDAIGYNHSYVSSEQINSNKAIYVDKIMSYIDKGVPVIVKTNLNTRPGFKTDVLTYFIYVGYEDYGNTLLFIREETATIFKYDTREMIEQDWIFIGDKKCDISYEEIIRNAVIKMPYWFKLPERNGMCFGAEAFRTWADNIENGRYENEKDLWGNYSVYIVNLATNAGNSGNEPYIIKKFAEIDSRYQIMCDQIMNLYVNLSNQDGGVWKALEELGGGFNVTREVMCNKEKRTQIAMIIRKAADYCDELVKILEDNLLN